MFSSYLPRAIWLLYYLLRDYGPWWQTILFIGVIKFTFIDHGTADRGGSPFYSAVSGSGILQSLRELYREEQRFVPAANRKIIIDPKSISRLKTNKKRFQPATGFNKKTAALRAFESE